MRALLVVNPTATATSARTRDVLAQALASAAKLDVVETTGRGHATALAAEAARDGLDVVVALGGDGTVNEVVNGLLEEGPGDNRPRLAVVPGGSTNVFARAIGLPAGPFEAAGTLLEALREGRRRRVGLGLASWEGSRRWFTFNAGLGFDAQVVRRVEARRAAGRRASGPLYVTEAVREFYRNPRRGRPPLTLTVPGTRPVDLHLALVCAASPWTYLGTRPVRPCPEASFDAGLDAFGLRRFGTVPMLRHLRQILVDPPCPRGRAVYGVHDAPELTLEAGAPVAFQVDGDDLGDVTRVRLVSVADALEVVV